MVRFVVVAAGLVLALAACAPVMAESQARDAALKFYMSAHVPGSKVDSFHILSTAQGTRDCPGGWAVNVSGEITEPGSDSAYANPMWLCVDSVSGKVTITAQG